MSLKVVATIDDASKHEYDVNGLLFNDGILYSAADDGKIKAWNNDLKIACEVQAHPCSVYAICKGDNCLYSCSNEGTIKSWSLKDLQAIKTVFKDTECEIWKIKYDNGVLFSGDEQGVIRTFKDDKLYDLVNILEPVKDMAIENMILFSSRDLEVVITEIRPGNKGQFGTRKTFDGRAPLCLSGDKLCFSSRDGKDLILHSNKQEENYQAYDTMKNAHEMIVNCLVGCKQGNDLFVYSGGWDKVLKKWKVTNNKLELVGSCQVDICINAIAVGSKGDVFVAGGDGKVIKIN